MVVANPGAKTAVARPYVSMGGAKRSAKNVEGPLSVNTAGASTAARSVKERVCANMANPLLGVLIAAQRSRVSECSVDHRGSRRAWGPSRLFVNMDDGAQDARTAEGRHSATTAESNRTAKTAAASQFASMGGASHTARTAAVRRSANTASSAIGLTIMVFHARNTGRAHYMSLL